MQCGNKRSPNDYCLLFKGEHLKGKPLRSHRWLTLDGSPRHPHYIRVDYM